MITEKNDTLEGIKPGTFGHIIICLSTDRTRTLYYLQRDLKIHLDPVIRPAGYQNLKNDQIPGSKVLRPRHPAKLVVRPFRYPAKKYGRIPGSKCKWEVEVAK